MSALRFTIDAELEADMLRSAARERTYWRRKSNGPLYPATTSRRREVPRRQPDPSFVDRVLVERARLALADPLEEADAVAPLTERQALDTIEQFYDLVIQREHTRWLVKGRHACLPRRPGVANGPLPTLGQRDLIRALGGDPATNRGIVVCPAHEDRHPSLSWRLTPTGKVLLHCFAGCDFDSIRKAVA